MHKYKQIEKSMILVILVDRNPFDLGYVFLQIRAFQQSRLESSCNIVITEYND